MKKVYLDNHLATPPFAPCIESMAALFTEQWVPSGSPSKKGQETIRAINASLKNIYRYIGAEDDALFVLTKSAEEASNYVLLSTYFDVVRQTGRTHFLTTEIEDPSILLSIKRLELLGCAGKMLPLNLHGQLTKQVLEEAIKPRSALVAISWANGLTGVLQPLQDIAAVCQEKEVLLYVDASYVMGKLFFRLQDLNLDFFSFGSSALHLPAGIGGLFMRSKSALNPLILGEKNHYAAPFAALEYACKELFLHCDHLCTEIARLRDLLEKRILASFKEAKVLFCKSDRLPNVSVIAFPGVNAEALLYHVQQKGVYATCGMGHGQKLDQILRLCGVDETLCYSALSFALSYETTEEDIEYAADQIVQAAHMLRSYSLGVL